MGAPDLAEEIPPKMLHSQRMPGGAGWMRTLYRQGSSPLGRLDITTTGKLHLAVQYEHAKYELGTFRMITGEGNPRRAQMLDSCQPYWAGNYVNRITKRNRHGAIKSQELVVGSRVPAKAAAWLRASGVFPTAGYPIFNEHTSRAIGQGEVSRPFFNGI